MNVVVERIESGQGRAEFAMYRSPGLSLWRSSALGSVCRGLLVDPTNDHLFAVQDGTIYDILTDGSINRSYAPISNDGLIVSMDESRNTLFVVSNSILYRVFGGALSTPTTPFTPAAVAVISGRIVALEKDTNRFYWSDDDGATWNALDFQTAETYPNTLLNIIVDHQELWLFGNRRTQVYVTGNDPDAPFDSVSAGIIEVGLAAKLAVGRLDNSIFWLGRNRDGDHIRVS